MIQQPYSTVLAGRDKAFSPADGVFFSSIEVNRENHPRLSQLGAGLLDSCPLLGESGIHLAQRPWVFFAFPASDDCIEL